MIGGQVVQIYMDEDAPDWPDTLGHPAMSLDYDDDGEPMVRLEWGEGTHSAWFGRGPGPYADTYSSLYEDDDGSEAGDLSEIEREAVEEYGQWVRERARRIVGASEAAHLDENLGTIARFADPAPFTPEEYARNAADLNIARVTKAADRIVARKLPALAVG